MFKIFLQFRVVVVKRWILMCQPRFHLRDLLVALAALGIQKSLLRAYLKTWDSRAETVQRRNGAAQVSVVMDIKDEAQGGKSRGWVLGAS